MPIDDSGREAGAVEQNLRLDEQGAIPLLVAVLTGAVTAVTLGLQVAFAALAVVLAVRPVRPPGAR